MKGCDTFFCVKLKIVSPDLPKLQFYRYAAGVRLFEREALWRQPVPYNDGDADTGKGGVDNASLRDIVEAYNCHLLRHLVASETQGLDGSDCNQVIVRKIAVCQSIPLSIIASISAIAPSMVGESWWMIQRERDIPLSWTA